MREQNVKTVAPAWRPTAFPLSVRTRGRSYLVDSLNEYDQIVPLLVEGGQSALAVARKYLASKWVVVPLGDATQEKPQ